MQRFPLFAFLFLLSSFCFPLTPVHAATYTLAPVSGSHALGEPFVVRVMVDSAGQGVNTGDATISYDTAHLTAVSVSKDGSPFNLWVTEPAINASAGTISFAGGGTTAIAGTKAVVSITFKGKAEGTAEVKFAKASLLAGAGQNVLTGSTGASFTITPASAKPPSESTPAPVKQERNVKIPVPDAPVLKSTTHPDQSLWYHEQQAKVTWDIPYGVLGLKLGFGSSSNVVASELHEPPISEWSKEGLPDGVWYLTVQYRNRGGWGSSTMYKLQVDATPPEPFAATALGGDLTAQVRFEANDALSGIALYRIGVDAARSRDVQESELSGGGYTLTNLDPGDHAIKVVAVDRAGNEREAAASVTVTGTKPVEAGAQPVTTSGFGAIYWVSLLFMAALAVVITLLVQERRTFHEEKEHIKRETMEAGDKLINIFGVLRDEIEEKVLELSHKPNMTENERMILEGLKDALDISEELLDKEIEDVRKLLK